jgi:hypothetical protein
MRRIVESESLPIEITGLAFIEQRGSVGCYLQRKPTPAEIKAAHPKCGSCDYAVKPDPRGMTFCGNQSTILTGYAVNPTTHYCPHHQPKEQQ